MNGDTWALIIAASVLSAGIFTEVVDSIVMIHKYRHAKKA